MRDRWYRIDRCQPPEKGWVIVTLADFQQGMGRRTTSGDWELLGVLSTGAPVTHWCYLPEPASMETA